LKGILAAGILSGGNPSSTFTEGMGNSGNIHKTRAYMVFILAFVAILSIVVSVSEKLIQNEYDNAKFVALYWFYALSYCSSVYIIAFLLYFSPVTYLL
jgi:hypothetical protein